MTPIEQAARALADLEPDLGDGAENSLSELIRDYANGRNLQEPEAAAKAFIMQAVRAVIAAIREPSEGMVSDGAFQIFQGERIAEDDLAAARRVWRAMTSRLLAES